MSFSNEATFDSMSSVVGSGGRSTIGTAASGDGFYDKWQTVRQGRTNAQLAADAVFNPTGKTEQEIAEMDAAFAALLYMDQYLKNGTPPQGDHYQALLKFA